MGSLCRRLISTSARHYASPLDGTAIGPFRVFDRRMKQMQKDRAASADNGHRSRTVDYLRDEVADRVIERFAVRNSRTVRWIESKF